MISNKTVYGIRALVHLALDSRRKHIGLREMASQLDIPLRFLELVFSRLRGAEIVRSVRGSTGGYFLAKPAEQINLAEIISACEGQVDFSARTGNGNNSGKEEPISRTLYSIVQEQLSKVHRNFQTITLTDLIKAAGLSSEMYWI